MSIISPISSSVSPSVPLPENKAAGSVKSDERLEFKDPQDILCFMLMQIARDHNRYLEVEQRRIAFEKAWQANKMEKRHQMSERLQKEQKAMQSFSQGEKLLTHCALSLSGVSAIFSGMPIRGTLAAFTGAFFFLDSLMDDAAKRRLAGWLGTLSSENASAWLERLHIFLGIASIGTSIGLSGSKAVHIAIATSEFIVSFTKATKERQVNLQKSFLMELDACLERSHSEMEKLIHAIQETVAKIHEIYEKLHRLQKEQKTINSSMLTIH